MRALILAIIVACEPVTPQGTGIYRQGGLWHWRIGRFGGSLYLARR